MVFPYATLSDATEVVHSEMGPDGRVKVYIEKAVYDGFHHATCYLPDYTWENIVGFTDKQMSYYQEFVENNAHLIIRFAKEGDLLMPQIFKFGGYILFFWSNENKPTEPIHVHIAEHNPKPNATKIWITRRGRVLICNNNSHIPAKDLRKLSAFIEANSHEIMQKWYEYFGEISYYC